MLVLKKLLINTALVLWSTWLASTRFPVPTGLVELSTATIEASSSLHDYVLSSDLALRLGLTDLLSTLWTECVLVSPDTDCIRSLRSKSDPRVLLLLLRSMFVAVLNPQLGGSQEVCSPLM